jgi:hypothetical protein
MGIWLFVTIVARRARNVCSSNDSSTRHLRVPRCTCASYLCQPSMLVQQYGHQLSSLYLLSLVALPYMRAIMCITTLSQVRRVSHVYVVSHVVRLTMRWHPMYKATIYVSRSAMTGNDDGHSNSFLEFTLSHRARLTFEAAGHQVYVEHGSVGSFHHKACRSRTTF